MEDDPARLKAEREAADRVYNEALTHLDRAIQRLPADFPHPPPGPDDHQITPLNTLWKIDRPAAGRGLRGRFADAVRRVVAPLFEQQQAFNSAVVDHLNRNVPVARETRESIATTLTLLHDTMGDLVRFQSLLVIFGAINAVADELLKKSEAMLARDRRHEMRVSDLDARLTALQQQIASLQQVLEKR
ncbi:MAG: hypothetical protein AUF76_11650 [Acidobacteria bacterium 13_1_20CM_2_65_9]|nr:MAG: hypothetical protein AUF76_11650 [Acidobacteria bacterium 13_1_20CM_2_65_9]